MKKIKPLTPSQLKDIFGDSKPETSKKFMIFDNDEDFESFALKPDDVIKKSTISGMPYYDAEFTDAFNSALEDNFIFCIADEQSKIRKRKVLQKGMIMLDVSNNITHLEADEIKDRYPKAWIIDYRHHNKE